MVIAFFENVTEIFTALSILSSKTILLGSSGFCVKMYRLIEPVTRYLLIKVWCLYEQTIDIIFRILI